MRHVLLGCVAVASLVLGCTFAVTGAEASGKNAPPPPGTTTTTTTTTTVVTTTGPAVVEEHQPTIRLAILLDTSNSMDGLIGQAKTQLWTIVSEFAKVTHNGKKPRLLVALYHYGTPSLGAQNNYIKQLLPFTTELDQVSEKLYGLQTSGGDEYCGAVIRAALDQLDWGNHFDPRPIDGPQPRAEVMRDGDFNAVYIAGNEPFTQGPIDFRQSCALARNRHVLVNTIFCGQMSEGISTQWKEGADIAGGSYSSINQDAVTVYVPAPQDKELTELSGKLNTTYIYYGSAGRQKYEAQAAQDSNAASSSLGSAASRASVKGGVGYAGANGSWDAVNAQNAGKKMEDIDPKTLPENMQKMTMEQRKQYVAQKAEERAAIQSKIGKLSREREAYLAEQSKAKGGPTTLDAAIIKSIRSQAAAAGYVFEAGK